MNYDELPISRLGVDDAARRSIARELSRYYHELADSRERKEERFSIVRCVSQMVAASGDGLCDGYEREVCSAQAKIAGEHFDKNRVLIPLRALATRDLTAGIASAGGYLVGTEIGRAEPFDVLRPFSVSVEAGMLVLPDLTGNVTLSRITGASTAGWIATEATSFPTAQPTLGQAAMTPKVAAATVNLSRNFAMQTGAGAEILLRQQLLGAVGQLLDATVFTGTGASGQPLGLLQTPGIGTQAGASLAHAGILAMRRQVLAAGGRQDRLRWMGAPAVQELLGARERATGGGRFLWDDNGILGLPASATSNAPASTLTCGDFSQAVLGVWGPAALRLEINPYQDFRAGVIAARVILACDVAFPQPNAFSVATSIT